MPPKATGGEANAYAALPPFANSWRETQASVPAKSCEQKEYAIETIV